MKRKFEFFAIVIFVSSDDIRCSIIKRYQSNNSTFEQQYPNDTYEHIPDNEYHWDTSEEYGPYYSEEEAWASAYRIKEEMNNEYEEW